MSTPPEAITLITSAPASICSLHDFADLLGPFDFLPDEPGMASNHADRQAGADDAGPRREPFVDSLFERKNRMVPRADIPNGGHACLKRVSAPIVRP